MVMILTLVLMLCMALVLPLGLERRRIPELSLANAPVMPEGSDEGAAAVAVARGRSRRSGTQSWKKVAFVTPICQSAAARSWRHSFASRLASVLWLVCTACCLRL